MATYLFSGFTEEDLVSTNSIDMGQSFTVPGATTHSFLVDDDDGRMSGDTASEGVSDDRTQSVSIRKGSSNAGSGHIYLDEIYTLRDEAGHHYTMYELEVEGTSEDFYVFQDPPPAPGTRLTVVGMEDATAGEVSYDDFAGDDDFDEDDEDVSTIYGGAGNDEIVHRGGNDTIYGGTGNDTLTGSDGDDEIYGGAGHDTIRGDGGADLIYGGLGDDWIDGGNQSDVLHAGEGDDHVEGDKGDDIFYGGRGADTMWGGEGDDLFVLEDGFGDDTIDGGNDAFDTDTDRIDLTGLSHGVEITYTDAESGSISQAGGTATFREIEEVGASEQGDVIDASATSSGMSLSGRGGDDTITGGAGDDHLDGGPGDDRVSGGAGHDALWGGAGADRLEGGAGDDSLDLGAQPGETDTVVLSDGDGHDIVFNFEAPIDNGDGTRTGRDQIDVSGLHDAGGHAVNIRDVTVTAAPDDPADAILSFPNGESLRLVGVSAASIDDTNALIAMGIPAPDGIVSGTSGNDVMTPGYEDDDGDRIDSGDAFRDGASGDEDVIAAGAGDDTVEAGAADDTVYGGDGHDSLDGGAGNDTLFGGAGDDRIHIAHGDTATGGAGDDLFLFDDEGETGTPDTTLAGGEGFDTLDLRSASRLETLSMAEGSDGVSGSVLMDNGSTLRFSQMERVICFTAGTRIATPFGPRRAEDLAVGDLVLTRDHGPRPLRWTGSRRAAAIGACAPIRLRPGVLPGLRRDLLVSPQHRMLFEGYRAQLLFGEDEVLVAARHLVDGRDVTVEEGGEVTYVHLLFDAHEIVMAEGAATESFQPGLRGLLGLDGPSRARLLDVCPGLRAMPDDWGPSARPTLRAHEAKALFA